MNNINISQNLRKMQKHFACQLEYVLHKKKPVGPISSIFHIKCPDYKKVNGHAFT